jgi:hypothetical protein
MSHGERVGVFSTANVGRLCFGIGQRLASQTDFILIYSTLLIRASRLAGKYKSNIMALVIYRGAGVYSTEAFVKDGEKQ